MHPISRRVVPGYDPGSQKWVLGYVPGDQKWGTCLRPWRREVGYIATFLAPRSVVPRYTSQTPRTGVPGNAPTPRSEVPGYAPTPRSGAPGYAPAPRSWVTHNPLGQNLPDYLSYIFTGTVYVQK
jgi:hypothetical protein